MDLCDKCSELLTCGQENSPKYFGELVETMEISIADEPLLYLEPEKGVCPEIDCIVNAQKKAMVTSYWENMFYSTGVVNYKKSFKCNRKFFTYSNLGLKNYVGNMRYCCSLGMQLVTIDTKEKFDCMIKNKITLKEDAGVFFMVAASRLGRLDRPSWCLSNKEFNLSFAEDLMSNDTLETNFGVALTFDEPYRMKAVQFTNSGICESSLDN